MALIAHRVRFSLILSALLLAACSLRSNDCARPEVVCVGLVTSYGKVDDHGLNQSAWEGVQQALAERLIQKADVIESVDARDGAKNIAAFLNAKYDIIVTVGNALDEDTRLAADEWPDRRFIGVDQPQSESRPNLAALVFPEDQGGFLAGALAALTTQTGKVAALCEQESFPPMWRYCEGFRVGVHYANPDLRARVMYRGESAAGEFFNDPKWGEEQAAFMLAGGVDILFAAGGETARAALNLAASRHVYVIGADEDLYYQIDYPDLALNSAAKQAGKGVLTLLRAVTGGQFPAGETRGEFALGSYHSLERLALPSVRERLEQIQRGLADGSIQTGIPPQP